MHCTNQSCCKDDKGFCVHVQLAVAKVEIIHKVPDSFLGCYIQHYCSSSVSCVRLGKRSRL